MGDLGRITVLKRGGGKALFCCLENIIVIVFFLFVSQNVFFTAQSNFFFQVLKYELVI